MPRPKPVPPLSPKNAARVFLDILSRSKHDRDFILNRFREALADSPSRPSVKRPSVFFNIILEMENSRQKAVLKILDAALDAVPGMTSSGLKANSTLAATIVARHHKRGPAGSSRRGFLYTCTECGCSVETNWREPEGALDAVCAWNKAGNCQEYRELGAEFVLQQ